MATAKTIEQLSEATQINASDQMAFVQASGKEAVRGSVQMLAGAVAEINEKGALAELAYATSQGKNLLAQNLTAKGVPTQENETLIQMADKVNNLNLDTQAETVFGKAISADSQTITNQGGCYVFRLPQNQDMVILMADTIYYVPYGKYSSFEDIIAAATATLQVESGYSVYQPDGACALSADGSKLLVSLNAAGLMRIYNVSPSSFKLLREFTAGSDVFATAGLIDASCAAVSNDGTFIVTKRTRNDTNFIFYNTQTATAYQVALNNSESYCGGMLLLDGALYIISTVADTDDDYGYTRFHLVEFSTQDGAISFNAQYTFGTRFMSVYAAQILYHPSCQPVFLFGFNNCSIGAQDAMAAFRFSYLPAVFLKNGGEQKFGPWLRVKSRGFAEGNQSYLGVCTSTGFVTKGEDNILSLQNPAWTRTIKIDTVSGALDDSTDLFAIVDYTASNANSKNNNCLYAHMENGIILSSTTRWGHRFNSSLQKTVFYPDNKILGKKRTINGKIITFLSGKVTPEDLAAGYYDAQTTVLPATPEAEAAQ